MEAGAAMKALAKAEKQFDEDVQRIAKLAPEVMPEINALQAIHN